MSEIKYMRVQCYRGTKFRLTVNLWTPAGLTNGAIGCVHSLIYQPGKKPPQQPFAIIATFDSYLGPAWRDSIPKSVVITPFTRTWFTKSGQNSRTMLPLILGYAITIHKLQGSTEDKIILNPGHK